MENDIIIAKTHSAEYQIHKYWARKPHNVIRHYINKYFKPGDLVCDPFFGSGIFLVEAKKSNIDCVGFDINPTAYEIANFTLMPPNREKFEKEYSKIYQELLSEFSDLYKFKGSSIKYLVHILIYICPDCQTRTILKDKGIKECPQCKKRIFANLERCKTTKVVEIILESGEIIIEKPEFKDFDNYETENLSSIFKSKPLINRRILSFPNLTLGDFFTNRAKSFVTRLGQLIDEIKDEKIRNSMNFFFASCLIQFSRLIPYRNNLDTGGPAWSIPGFWVAQKHLETNPLVVIEGRFKKFLKAIDKLAIDYSKSSSKATIYNYSYNKGFAKYKKNSFDGIFLDPPYGGDVPYLEFSFLWNSYYKKSINYESEIVVSDRIEHRSDWGKYYKDIFEVIETLNDYLKPHGKIILTFNNLNPEAWIAILESFVKNSFKIIEASYQIPAVVSSKAQKAKNTSYIGDYYLVFEKVEKPVKLIKDDTKFYKLMEPCLYSRKGTFAKNILLRHLILSVVRYNLSLDYIKNMDSFFNNILELNGDFYNVKTEFLNNKLIEKYCLEKEIDKIIHSHLKGNNFLKKLAQIEIIKRTEHLGTPSLTEIDFSLSKQFNFKGEKLILKELELF